MTRLVLLVEDNPDHVLIAVDAIEATHASGVEIHVARDGQEALDYLRDPAARRPDLILLDIQMPRVDGFEVLAQIKADEALRMIPVVVLTSSDSERDVAQSHGLGSTSFLTKPVGVDALDERLAQIPSYWFSVNKPLLEVHE